MLPEILPQSEPLTCRIGTLEELVIEPNMGMSTSMAELDFLEDPEYCKFIKSFPNDDRFLLLTDNDKLWIWDFLFFTMESISYVRKEKFERIIFINCLDMNDAELRNEIFSNDINNNVLALYDISKKNVSFFKKMKPILLGKKPPLIVASLRKDEKKAFLNEELRTAFLVVNALKPDKEVAGSEGSQVGETITHKLQQKEDSHMGKTVAYEWAIKNERDIYCNGQHIVKLPNLEFALFKCLYKKLDKHVKNKTLEKCWKNKKVSYKSNLSTAMSHIRSKLKTGLKKNSIPVKGYVIESKQENKKNVSYKLVT
ncbi:helix-turn-helix domain-containing protein [Candidatus Scalindua japonica]|nr:helix-turn-helix domain-containing protein [Candidatus Scalindua japonica]